MLLQVDPESYQSYFVESSIKLFKADVNPSIFEKVLLCK